MTYLLDRENLNPAEKENEHHHFEESHYYHEILQKHLMGVL